MTQLESLIKDLKKATISLKEAIELKPTRIHKDATIQRFEFSFELAWKSIQAFIRDQGFDCKSPKSCLRMAATLDLIKDIEAWFEYLKARNFIAHVYSENLADKIYKKALKFPKDLEILLKNLK